MNRSTENELLWPKKNMVWIIAEVAIRLNNLAQLLQDTNRLAEAEPMMRHALAIDEKSYGPEHPDVAIRLNNLAGLLQATNRLAEAEPLMRRALAIDEKNYSQEHPDVAIDLSNLAALLHATNRQAMAEPLMHAARWPWPRKALARSIPLSQFTSTIWRYCSKRLTG